jgi:hypothetical protein
VDVVCVKKHRSDQEAADIVVEALARLRSPLRFGDIIS